MRPLSLRPFLHTFTWNDPCTKAHPSSSHSCLIFTGIKFLLCSRIQPFFQQLRCSDIFLPPPPPPNLTQWQQQNKIWQEYDFWIKNSGLQKRSMLSEENSPVGEFTNANRWSQSFPVWKCSWAWLLFLKLCKNFSYDHVSRLDSKIAPPHPYHTPTSRLDIK